MAQRGFFAALQHQSRVAAQQRERAERELYRKVAASVQQSERARKASERAQAQLSKAATSERKRFEKEALEAHVTAQEAQVAERNESLKQIYEEIDTLLATTLQVDDYVDLNSLRIDVVHPPFGRADLELPIPKAGKLANPIEPVLALPDPPSGLFSFFGKKKYEDAVEVARRVHVQAVAHWRAACDDVLARRQKAEEERARDEQGRIAMLTVERERYEMECAARVVEASERNRKLDELIANLGYGTADAIQEYVSIVLSNSVYPEHFQMEHEFEFDASMAELRLRVLVPAPSELPEVKAYKYSKAADEITSSALSQKECRERYAGAIQQVALRSFHEVFESDRRGLIKTISLEVGTDTIDPATGQRTNIPFVIAAAERESFLAFALSAVVPALTLARLGAALSKNPYSLSPAERVGVRRS